MDSQYSSHMLQTPNAIANVYEEGSELANK